ncbi:hypothetical protein DFH27DRAFT_617561 [Peziza echinospora]|nr:hypothetical protein DFH27DRAFT_617561 [Peziza echinospora]
MAVWSHVVHNSTNIQVEVLGAGAINSSRQSFATTYNQTNMLNSSRNSSNNSTLVVDHVLLTP